MSRARLTKPWVFSVSVTLMLPGPSAQAASHLWRINEVFSNADGTVQFIELKESMGSTAENFILGKLVTSNTKTFTIPGNLAGSTANKHLLFATAAFAALPGAPTPDYIIVSNFFALNGDTIKYAPVENFDTFTFGVGALPTNGVNSIQITNYTTHTFTTGPNSPTNFADQTGSVDAGCSNDADCNDGNPCTIDTCDTQTGTCLYSNAPIGTLCSDDGNPCTDDQCNNGTCSHLPNNNPCDDGDPCTTADHCPGPPSTTCTGTHINSISCPPDCPLDPGGVPYECVNGFCFCAPPAANDIVWDPDPLSPDRTTRSLRFRLSPPATATGGTTNAIKVELVGLGHPNPRNAVATAALPTQTVPQNFSKFDTNSNGVCSGAAQSPNYNGHPCDTNADCVCNTQSCTSNDAAHNGVCSSLVACTAVGEGGGCARWVGQPATFAEAQQRPDLGHYRAARLQCSPFYWDWAAELAGMACDGDPADNGKPCVVDADCTGPGPGKCKPKVITVIGAEILPSSTYGVQAYGSSCKGTEATCADVSSAVTMFTRRHGDFHITFNPPGIVDEPDGLDVACVVDSFGKHFPPDKTGVSKTTAKATPNVPEHNLDVDAADIARVVDGVKGYAYPPAEPGPCPCPSTVTCGTPCTCDAGPPCPACGGGQCVKTCTGGANDGLACRDNDPVHNHCPLGTCGSGFCRDKCARCN